MKRNSSILSFLTSMTWKSISWRKYLIRKQPCLKRSWNEMQKTRSMRRHGYSLTPLLLFSFEERMDVCLIFSHCPLNHAAIGTLSTSRSSMVLPSFSVLPTCKRTFSAANERLYSSDRSFPVTTRTLPCKSSSVYFSDNPTERQSLSILRNSASMGNHSFALSTMRLRLPISR